MKRLLTSLTLLLALLMPTKVWGQTQRLAALSTTICPGAGCVVFPVSFLGSIGLQTVGPFVGTLTVSGSSNGTDYSALNLIPLNGGTAVSTMTGNGIWSGSVMGLAWVKVAFTAYTSGTANIALVSATARGPGAPGTINGGTCTGSVVTGISSAGDLTCEANPSVTSVTATNAAAAQATFSGWDDVAGGFGNSGSIWLGNGSNATRGKIHYDGQSGHLYFDNAFDAATSLIRFRTRTAGTPVVSLELSPSGATSPSFISSALNPAATGFIRSSHGNLWLSRDNLNSTNYIVAGLGGTIANTVEINGPNSLINTDIYGSSVRFVTVGPHAIGGATDPTVQWFQRGAFISSGDVYGYYLNSSLSPAAGSSAYGHRVNPTLGKAGSGNHPLFASTFIDVATVGAGAATISNTASLYVAGAMSATVSGKNYALWSAAGENRFGGTVTADGIVSAVTYQAGGNAFATATIGPTAPAGTTSTTLVMAGLAGSITTRTGRIMLCMSGVMADSVANDGSKVQMSYGTGSAPIAGAALTGTQVGPIQQFNAANIAAETVPYGACWPVTTLIAGTTYWLDTAFAAITGGTATLTQASMVAHDIP